MRKIILSVIALLLVFCSMTQVSCAGRKPEAAETTQSTAGATTVEDTTAGALSTAALSTAEPDTDPAMPEIEYGGRPSLRLFINGFEYIPDMRSSGKEACFFLPAGADLSALSVFIDIGEKESVRINGKNFKRGYRVFDLSDGKTLEANFVRAGGGAVSYSFKQTSTNSLYLATDGAPEDISAVNADKAHETSCTGTAYFTGKDPVDSFDTGFIMHGRGNATWTDEKKSYSINFTDESGERKNKVSVCGMDAGSKYALLASHRDCTLIRSALALTLAQTLGLRSAAGFVFTDLFINGEYNGLYMLTERITKQKAGIELAEKDSLEGGYLLEFDNYGDSPQIKLKISRMRVTINSPTGLESYDAIQGFLNEAESALHSPDGVNEKTGKRWDEYLDADSFAKLWIVREYSMDYDANVNFHCFYDPSDGKLHAGPAWDFDNSFARSTGTYADPYAALIESGERNENCFLTLLTKLPEFRQRLAGLYEEHRYLFDDNDGRSVLALAEKYREELASSIDMNFTLWRHRLTSKGWNYPKDDLTYNGYFGILTGFIKGRDDFWSAYMPGLTE